jgi:hypothetical protein
MDMSLRFEIADWSFEVTWSEIAFLPVRRDGLEAAAEPEEKSSGSGGLFLAWRRRDPVAAKRASAALAFPEIRRGERKSS